MNIISVIPLARTRSINELSYFTASEIPVGAIVSVPLRNKKIHAIVVTSRTALDIKSEIRNAPYELKKLGKVRTNKFFPATFIQSCIKIADHYATSLGSVINTLINNDILENSNKLTKPLVPETISNDETYVVQGDDEDRMSTWRSLIRQEFARKKSVVMYVPTIEDAKSFFLKLEKGVEGYIFTLHGGINEKKIIETWKTIAKTEHPVFVIAVGSYSLLPRKDIETVIIERENGRGWIGQRTPYIDLRYALETIAKKNRQTIYIADIMLRIETLHRLDEGELNEGNPFKWRSVSTSKDLLVNMKREKKVLSNEKDANDQTNESRPFRVLSPELENLIKFNREENYHLFIYTVRRGISPSTICNDCETIVTCKKCETPVILHASQNNGKNFFMCHACGERRSAQEVCINCGSWNLVALGIGIERVEQAILEKFPNIEIFKIDTETTKTEKQIRATLEKFRTKPGSILLGTDMALSYIHDKIDNVAVASLDSLFALPDFRIQEKIMYTLTKLRALATQNILVQTRRAEETLFGFGLKGNLSDFVRMITDERKEFLFPPFSVLIKITIEGKKDTIAEEMNELINSLGKYVVDIFPAFTSTNRGNSIIHGLIKIDPKIWPDMELVSKLKSLPPNITVKINPESLL